MLLDGLARLRVGRDVDAPLPHLDRFVPEAGLLVEHGEVLQRGEVLRVELDGALELLDAVVDLALLP